MDAATDAVHMRDLLQRLGLAAYGGNYESIRGRLDRSGVLEERFLPRPRRSAAVRVGRIDADELRRAAADARSLADILRRLGLPVSPSAYRKLHAHLALAGIDVSHLAGQGWSRGLRDLARVPLESLLVVGTARSVGHLKERLIREGVLQPCCDMCGLRQWLGHPAPLELDHVNGDRRDNRRENLRLLRPNCHALTPTYRGRNIGRVDLRTPELGS